MLPTGRARLLVVPLWLALWTACSGGVGSSGGLVGGECASDRDCAETCVEGKDFPDGTCTLSCNDHDDCPPGTYCIGKEGGICLLGCRDDRDCRGGYDCDERDAEDGRGDEFVCIE